MHVIEIARGLGGAVVVALMTGELKTVRLSLLVELTSEGEVAMNGEKVPVRIGDRPRRSEMVEMIVGRLLNARTIGSDRCQKTASAIDVVLPFVGGSILSLPEVTEHQISRAPD